MWSPLLIALTAAGLVARGVFWAMTDRRFEDGLITVAHARSVAEGIGLTHHPGEPVTHGFTTALSVLIPIPGELIATGGGLVALRLVSLVAFVATMAFAFNILRELGVGRLGTFFALAYIALAFNHIFYGMSGMETQVGVALLLAGIYFVIRRNVTASGLLLGLSVLARPEFAIWVGLALLSLFFWQRRGAIRAGLIAAAVVLPWLVFTTLYYGSFIPNTVTAKGLRYPVNAPALVDGPGPWLSWIRSEVLAAHDFWHAFTPFLENGLVAKAPLPEYLLSNVSFVFLVLALIGVWATRHIPGWRAAVAFAGLFVVYRTFLLPPGYYEWYLPPLTALVALLAGAGLSLLVRSAPRTAAFLAIGLALAFAAHIPFSFPLEARIQHDVEDRVRKPMGEWLKANVAPAESITSESAGYIGYYSRRLLYDYPGLTSKRVREIFERLGPERNNMFELVKAAHPNWIVMRPYELDSFRVSMPDEAGAYTEVRRFVVAPDARPLTYGGMSMINIDTQFVVLRRSGKPPRSSS